MEAHTHGEVDELVATKHQEATPQPRHPHAHEQDFSGAPHPISCCRTVLLTMLVHVGGRDMTGTSADKARLMLPNELNLKIFSYL
jgi:hypothetical protein